MTGTTNRRPLRGITGIVAAILAVGALAITPALAAKFLTKQKADKRYLGNTAVATTVMQVPTQQGVSITVLCPGGRQATGGGASSPAFISSNTNAEGMILLERKPFMSGGRSVGWVSEVVNATPNTLEITGYAVCAP